ncbi:hypothetical protein ACJ8PK_24030, partial [Serratia sp. CY81593]
MRQSKKKCDLNHKKQQQGVLSANQASRAPKYGNLVEMERTQHNQDTESVTTLEIRLPWVTSSAWQTVLSQTPLDFESTKDIYFQLKEQAQDIIGAELTPQDPHDYRQAAERVANAGGDALWLELDVASTASVEAFAL